MNVISWKNRADCLPDYLPEFQDVVTSGDLGDRHFVPPWDLAERFNLAAIYGFSCLQNSARHNNVVILMQLK